SSVDGTKLVAAAGRTSQQGPIYTSTDGGQSWISNNLAPNTWRSVACSADGSRTFAETTFGDLLITTNFGALWTSSPAPGGTWAITCSPDGTTVLAGGANSSASTCVSTNSGLTWTTNQLSSWRPWSVAMSADGKKLRAVDGVGNPGGLIYTSTN